MVMMEGKLMEPLQCYVCGGNHKLRDFPRKREDPRGFHNLESATIVGDMARVTT